MITRRDDRIQDKGRGIEHLQDPFQSLPQEGHLILGKYHIACTDRGYDEGHGTWGQRVFDNQLYRTVFPSKPP
jgi:hypothetical protein